MNLEFHFFYEYFIQYFYAFELIFFCQFLAINK